MTNNNTVRLYHLVITTLCTLLLTTGCSSTLHIDNAVPRPLTESLPLDAGVYYTDSLRGFRFERAADTNSAAWEIELGTAQVHLFDQVLQQLFATLVELDTPDASATSIPLAVVLQPSIDEYILTTPLDTATTDYEVTIRYSLAFHRPSGELIQRWSFSGHGRQTGALLSNDETVRKATTAAMRDAAAWLVVEFSINSGIDTLLQARQNDNENGYSDQDS